MTGFNLNDHSPKIQGKLVPDSRKSVKSAQKQPAQCAKCWNNPGGADILASGRIVASALYR